MTEPRELNWRSPDGLNLFAREYGSADSARLPVIRVPGLTRNSRDFEDVAPWIAATGRRVIAVDLRGRGRSDRDPNPKRYIPLTYAADMIALLDSLKIPRALFVGTSLGGMVTMTLASKHIDRIGGAISDVLDVPTASRMRKEAPGMAYVEVDDVGHAPTLSEPAAKEALTRFLSEAP